ncbi:hypothetical protein V1524DRAFT_472417 [Lipomyces starkeyi]
MCNDEEHRVHQIIRELIFKNEPDKEYEFEISSSSYEKLKVEFMKHEENDAYVIYPRLFYDWTRQVVTIVTAPSRLHEDTSSAILSSIYNRVESILQREQVQLAADEKLSLRIAQDIVVVEAGVSQTYESLEGKARKWIFGKKCTIILLVALDEKRHYSALDRHIYLASREMNERVEQMRLQCESQSLSQFGPLVFQGHTLAFIEVVRINPDPEGTEALLKRKYVLIHEGVNESSNVPGSVGDIRLGEVMPRESLGNEAAGDIVVDFFSAVDFMHIVRNAMVDTAVDRFEDAVKIFPSLLSPMHHRFIICCVNVSCPPYAGEKALAVAYILIIL